MTHGFADRRHFHRTGAAEHGITSARVRPGHLAAMIDVSAGGASIEIARRLLPGTAVDLQLNTPHRAMTLRGRVLRCAVTRLHSTSVSYRAAIAFDRQWPGFLEGGWSEYQVPTNERGSTADERVDPTRGME